MSVLTSSQESILQSHRNQLIIIHGCKAADTAHLGDSLCSVFSDRFYHPLTQGDDIHSLPDKLNDLNSDGNHCYYIPASTGWTMKWIKSAADSIKHRYSSKRVIKIVFLADPGASWDLLQSFDEYNIVPMHLEPWTRAMISEWTNAHVEWRNFSAHIERISLSTGRWAYLLYEFLQKLQQSAMIDTDDLISCIAPCPARYKLFGVTKLIQKKVLWTIALLDSTSIEVLTKELSDVDVFSIEKTILWAESMGYLTAGEEKEGSHTFLNTYLSSLLLSEDLSSD